MAGEHQFDPSLISADTHTATPDSYAVRPLQRGDYGKGYFDCLATLTWVGKPTQQEFEEQYDWMTTKGAEWFYNVVIEYEASIHNFGKGGHIEDVSIASDHQGKGLGKVLINALNSVAKATGCYRCTLDCAPQNEGFYEKCGYHKGGTEMSQYFEEAKSDYERG
ncbi:Glucosamine 6-phosphate N-acetyltransferase [Cyphellophora attinorum]|uniref:Glucosamine 6-phosphate N-acetyltransferase n=1 Tax=Cyphellophora attinorum TaxID=1664694 RepID=A0A0N1HWS6_9EURO|nr:Glucosamine 6-phosphate N-acetyltransferase [Phialophora attinorum]KPI42187.1 Glucosamine 6-phosphate N-acetyltransferase [Phialophora attinorum]